MRNLLNRLFMRSFLIAIVAVAAQQASASTIVYTLRSDFQAALGSSITDDYENPGYMSLQNDAAMNAVLGETKYRSTGFLNINEVLDTGDGNHFYCAGCNGSFTLDFTSTSVGTSAGVFGVGLDILANSNQLFTAFVTFGDSSTQDFVLPQIISNASFFFGLTSDLDVASIAFGPGNGGISTRGHFEIDNLTIGSEASAVPEPSTLGLIGLGLLGLGGVRRRRRYS